MNRIRLILAAIFCTALFPSISMAAPKVLMVVTSQEKISSKEETGLWLEEFVAPYDVFRKAKWDIVIASPKGGSAPIDPRSKPTPEQATAWAEERLLLGFTQPLKSLNADDFQAIFLVGGHGTMFDFPKDKALQNLLTMMAAAGKPIAAVCHGPAGFVNVKGPDGKPLVHGKRVTGFTNEEEKTTGLQKQLPFLLETKLKKLGADFVISPAFTSHIEKDGWLLTGQNPQSSAALATAVVDSTPIRP